VLLGMIADENGYSGATKASSLTASWSLKLLSWGCLQLKRHFS